MPESSPSEHDLPRPALTLTLQFLALLAMGLAIRNLWVQDDTGIIQHNPLVHSIRGVWAAFVNPYWPSTEQKELYRPLQVAFFTLQWVAASGAPWLFRVVNLLAYGASVAAVYALLRRLAPVPAAWAGAAIFAVHPVHVEAVALSVNQGETLVATLLCVAASQYIDLRRAGSTGWHRWWRVLLPYTVALFIKEHALILPGLLLALELTVLDTRTPLRDRARAVAGLFVALVVIGAAFWMIRGRVIGGGSGTAPMETLVGLTFAGRAMTMLGVVPEWVRLLLWPAHLQMEWSPLEYVPFVAWSLRDTLGVIALLSILLGFALSFRRRPLLALAILWAAVAIFPVSNLAIATGVLVAERTLFLASVGVAFLVADLSQWGGALPQFGRRPMRVAAGGAFALLLLTGIIASATRMSTWRDRILYLSSSVKDAPLSYRAHLSWGIALHEIGDTAQGNAELRHAMVLHPWEIRPFIQMARELQRKNGDCEPVLGIDLLILEKLSNRGDIRAGIAACATWLGRYDLAAETARRSIELKIDGTYWAKALEVIDSAATHKAPPRTVHLPHLPGDWVLIGDMSESAGTGTNGH